MRLTRLSRCFCFAVAVVVVDTDFVFLDTVFVDSVVVCVSRMT